MMAEKFMANNCHSELAAPAAEALTVAELLEVANHLLEAQIGSILIEAEVQAPKQATSGHIYLSLKDLTPGVSAKIDAVIWRGVLSGVAFPIEDGTRILCEGKLTIYPPSGKIQLSISRIMASGEGILRQKFIELKNRLENEGLFALERKRPIPFFPKTVGIVTSATGAALHDIMYKIMQRMPSTRVIVADSRVQGVGSKQEIVAGIVTLNQIAAVEVIIVARGGGSLEDLWSFNEEDVVRAIFASKLPVISAVGHEVDITLSDLVADLRCPTPTAAGETVVPDRQQLLDNISYFYGRLRNYQRWLAPRAQRLDECERRLQLRLKSSLHNYRQQLLQLTIRANNTNPWQLLNRAKQDLQSKEQRLLRQLRSIIELHKRTIATLESRIAYAKPEALLARGFALITDQDGQILTSVKQLSHDQKIQIRFKDGSLIGKIL
jgi:exodeoxyribonuclease VII large subunit